MTKREYNKQLKEYVKNVRDGKLGQGSTMMYNIKHSRYTLEEVYKEWRNQQKEEKKVK